MRKFRQKPLIIEAYQTNTETTVHNAVHGFIKANPGDWIIMHENGLMYVYNSEAFYKHYEEVKVTHKEKDINATIEKFVNNMKELINDFESMS